MRVYADTSWWFASKCRRDAHHDAATGLFDREADVELIWTPWQRVEVFNTFRQAERAGLVAAGESRQLSRLLDQEIRLGYWTHVELNWTDAIRTACELSSEHGIKMTVRGMDLFHVAIAIEVGADAFISFDRDQAKFAKSAGLVLL